MEKFIYYLDKELQKLIDKDFDLIEKKNWYLLFKNRKDNSYWRLDSHDKYHERFFVKLGSKVDWDKYDAELLIIELLKNSRGVSNSKCIWKNCDKLSLNELAYCEFHSYKEMGIRK